MSFPEFANKGLMVFWRTDSTSGWTKSTSGQLPFWKLSFELNRTIPSPSGFISSVLIWSFLASEPYRIEIQFKNHKIFLTLIHKPLLIWSLDKRLENVLKLLNLREFGILENWYISLLIKDTLSINLTLSDSVWHP